MSKKSFTPKHEPLEELLDDWRSPNVIEALQKAGYAGIPELTLGSKDCNFHVAVYAAKSMEDVNDARSPVHQFVVKVSMRSVFRLMLFDDWAGLLEYLQELAPIAAIAMQTNKDYPDNKRPKGPFDSGYVGRVV